MPTNDLHARLAATVLTQLETADPASWIPPWHGADPMPRNARTGRRYRVINVLALWCAAQTHGYADVRSATYRQWVALGAQVRWAKRGTLVLFYEELPRGTEGDPTDGGPFVARATHVFNAVQVDHAPSVADVPALNASPESNPLPGFDAFVRATGAEVRHGGDCACYVSATDTIHLPPRPASPSARSKATGGHLHTNSYTRPAPPTASSATLQAGSAPRRMPLKNSWESSELPSYWRI